jgi:hypothetical protein
VHKRKADTRVQWVLGLLLSVLGLALLLFTDSLAQMPRPVRGVPESRQAMGMNLPPYRMDIPGVPIDQQIIGDLERLGVKWVRFEFRAKGNPPVLPVADYHTAVDRLRAHDIEVLGLVDYTTVPAPQDAWGATEYRDRFISTTTWLASEFEGKIGAWEIWNEEDIGYDPGGTGGDTYLSPRDYAYLLGGDPTADTSTLPWAAAGVYQALKDVDPHATVLLGGLSNVWRAPDGRGAGHYLQAVYQELEVLGYTAGTWPFDVVALHPYYGLNPDPSVYLFDDGEYILRANIWSVMDEQGDGNKRIWITELGWNTNTTQWVCMPPLVSEANQAAYLETSWNIFLGEPTGASEVLVDKVFWFQYQDKGAWVDSERCPVATATPLAFEPAESYERVRPPRVTPVPDPAQPRGAPIVIDTWWGVVHGDYVPKPSYYIYLTYGWEHQLYLPMILRYTVGPLSTQVDPHKAP